ncbi:PREDICTED: fidgetin-like protein 1 [Nicotiana attenuata]|uniref:Katanin p60 atpase-containing subunit a1 n=1 Tax=Nicotiana attenuata TaxID=49451 RepID=A0A1J6JEV6_NICAT|nr:PREDICTED: fidgetin-like protein 1 [Nicotiana attenuata]OIT05585.1 katanin p60 atpase-containing subunit a1 [Nicotiana attenuata]
MAGKEDSTQNTAPNSESAKMEDEKSEVSWRKEIDTNLKRLHSMLFGAEVALEKKDFSSATVLGLGLIGFLDSHSHSDVDDAFIRPIRCEALSKFDSARRSLITESDRHAFEQAGRDPGCIFTKGKDIDIEKIKQSKYFLSLFQQHEGKTIGEQGNQSKRRENVSSRTWKTPAQTSPRDFSMMKNRSFGNDSSPEVLPVERFHPKHQAMDIKDEEEERTCNNGSKTRRLHRESSGSRDEHISSPLCAEETDVDASASGFVTAKTKLEMDTRQRRGLSRSPSASISPQSDNTLMNKGCAVRSYGFPRRGVRGNFVPPIRGSSGNNVGNVSSRNAGKGEDTLDDSTRKCLEMLVGPDGELPEKLRNIEPRLIEHISNEIMYRDPNVRWNDIAGLEHAKKCVTEMVIWPLLRPDIFRGCRSPGRGLLLFGPPGTGKTMIGKAIAGEAKATFFYISASSLTSKWIGEGEKLVRALFGVASCRQPAVIFVDEIDSLLSQRKSEGEHESSRRLKTQFLIEMEGFDTGSEQILLIGATNRPQELDEAARRRLTKRLYVPLPSSEARAWIVKSLLEKDGLFKLSDDDIVSICRLTEGYSGSDMKNLVKDASMGPLREALRQGIEITKLKKDDMRPVNLQDFEDALQEVRPSVSSTELGAYEDWNKQFGSLAI